jgi:nitrogen fixation protein NifQ
MPALMDPTLPCRCADADCSPFALDVPQDLLAERRVTRADEVADVAALLMDHIAIGTPECSARALSEGIAAACLGDRHLWEDLGLPSRDALWLLMQRHYPDLVARNSGRMRWKKFLYRELCIREQVLVCRSPSCEVCPEQAQCFAPELPHDGRHAGA